MIIPEIKAIISVCAFLIFRPRNVSIITLGSIPKNDGIRYLRYEAFVAPKYILVTLPGRKYIE
jgi:hypothetical protein